IWRGSAYFWRCVGGVCRRSGSAHCFGSGGRDWRAALVAFPGWLAVARPAAEFRSVDSVAAWMRIGAAVPGAFSEPGDWRAPDGDAGANRRDHHARGDRSVYRRAGDIALAGVGFAAVARLSMPTAAKPTGACVLVQSFCVAGTGLNAGCDRRVEHFYAAGRRV